jgi:hypothetical protein
MKDGQVTPGGSVRRMAMDLAGVSEAERDGLARAALRAGLAPET